MHLAGFGLRLCPHGFCGAKSVPKARSSQNPGSNRLLPLAARRKGLQPASAPNPPYNNNLKKLYKTTRNVSLRQLTFRVVFKVACYLFAPQHFLYFLPLPQGHGSFLPGVFSFTTVRERLHASAIAFFSSSV